MLEIRSTVLTHSSNILSMEQLSVVRQNWLDQSFFFSESSTITYFSPLCEFCLYTHIRGKFLSVIDWMTYCWICCSFFSILSIILAAEIFCLMGNAELLNMSSRSALFFVFFGYKNKRSKVIVVRRRWLSNMSLEITFIFKRRQKVDALNPTSSRF